MSDNACEVEKLKAENTALKARIAALEEDMRKDYEVRIGEMSKNMQKLREGKSRYRSLAHLLRMMCDNVPDMIWAKDLNGRYIFTNKSLCRDLLKAIDTQEPIGKNYTFFAERERNAHPENPDWHTFGENFPAADTDTIAMSAGASQQFDVFGNVQGKLLFLDVNKAPFIDINGKMIGTVGSARDVTSARQSERLLNSNRQKLALAMALANLVYWEYDTEKRQFLLDDQFLAQYCTSTEAEGGSLFSPREYLNRFVHPDDRTRLDKAMKTAIASDSANCVIQEEYRVIRRDGMVRHILTLAWLDSDSDNAPRRIYGANQDITERKKIEVALADSNSLLQTIINTSPIRVFWKDLDLRYLGCNSAFARDAGHQHPSDLIGKDDFQFNWKKQAERYRADDMLVMQSGNAKLAFEEQQTKPDGSQMWLRTSKVPLRNDSDKIIGVLGIYEDITIQKRAEADREKLESLNRYFQKNESLGRMAGAIAHHFNNRLQSVLGLLELAVQDLPQGCESAVSISAAIDECCKASEISSMMLAYLGRTPSRLKPLDLSELCRNCMPVLRATVGKSTSIVTSFPGQGPRIKANEDQIQQVLFNLIVNAWEASNSQNSRIHISISLVSNRKSNKERTFPLEWQPADSSYACLEVKDFGHGISEHEIDKIFDPFFTSKFTGRGLGLSVSLGIVRTHRGAISVESRTGQGSSFRVYLPAN